MRTHEQCHRLPTGPDHGEEIRLATCAVARLRTVGHPLQCDEAFDTDTREARCLPLGTQVGSLADNIRATTSGEVADIRDEVTAAYDGIFAGLATVLAATADFHQGLGHPADKQMAERLRSRPARARRRRRRPARYPHRHRRPSHAPPDTVGVQRRGPARRTRNLRRPRMPTPGAPHPVRGCSGRGPHPQRNLLPDTPDTHDLESFAIALADALPGTWRSAYHQHTDHPEQFSRAEDVWDMNLVSGALAQRVLGQDAVVTRDDGTRLYVIGRPGTEEFLVGAMAPPGIGPEAFRGVREPDGIAVPDDASRAVEDIVVDLLPRYDKALAQVQDNDVHPAAVAAPTPAREAVTMTWFDDGLLAAQPGSQKAAAVLHTNGFVWDPAEKAFVLSGDDIARQAQAAQAVGAQLSVLGIGTVVRHPPNRPAPATAPAAQPQRARSAVRAR
ncbi:hypothetical protein OG711_08000 [Streptomyces uncialis]|uniref:hypothetical protein n=1 Tax=Streptomyces uncialis TaxID=1048205 RepID=UPI002E2F3201|nr:hypothetical protein [Streptomyces uncialis]